MALLGLALLNDAPAQALLAERGEPPPVWVGQMGERAAVSYGGQVQVWRVGEGQGPWRVARLDAGRLALVDQRTGRELTGGGGVVSLGGSATTGRSTTLVAQAGADRLYHVAARINGQPVEALIDTGASLVTLSVQEAERCGVDYRQGRVSAVRTANGRVEGWQVRLARLRVQDHEAADVEAVVVPADLPGVLLGQSWLARFKLDAEPGRLSLKPR